MNYLYLTCLFLFSFYSCVSKQNYEEVIAKNNNLNRIVQTTNILDSEIKSLGFKIKNLEFSLSMCEVKLRRQDRKLVECLDMKGSCQ